MKVLVISAEVWQDKTNGGNVLSNIFKGMKWEFAQIYCNPGVPENTVCKYYYQMSDSMVLRNTLSHAPIGRSFIYECNSQVKKETLDSIEQPNKKFYEFFHNHRLGLFYATKHFLWNTSNWKNKNLIDFLDAYNPDIIFAPCYGDRFMLRLTRFVADYTGKRVISYISDDHYTLRQFSLSPIFWIERFILRHELRKTFPYYSLVYTMTDTQKEQCERDLAANMKILRKAVPYCNIEEKKCVNEPIKIVYAGGIYLNRWKTLKMLADEIRKINIDRKKIILDIYTANEITNPIAKALNDGENSVIHKPVSQSQLEKIYHDSDIALHVESFDIKNRLLVRMSFSTKIVDCLASGCAVMAICDSKQGGFKYLKDEGAAICVCSPEEIRQQLMRIVRNKEIIKEYSQSALKCCYRNHDAKIIQKMIENDFEKIAFPH